MDASHIFNLSIKYSEICFNNKSPYFIALVENWHDLIPEYWIGSVYPAGVKQDNQHREILLVKISSASLGLKASFDIPLALEKINSFFGYKVFSNIKITYLMKESE